MCELQNLGLASEVFGSTHVDDMWSCCVWKTIFSFLTFDVHVLDTNHFSFQFVAASYAPMGRGMAQRDDRVGRGQGLNDPIKLSTMYV